MRVETIGDATLYLGDCMEVLPTLGKVDAVITDPPYGIDVGSMSLGAGKKVSGFSPFSWDKSAPSNDLLRQCIEKSLISIIWGGNYFKLPPSGAWLAWDKVQKFSGAEMELAWTNLNSPVRVFRMSRIEAYGAIEKDHPTQKPIALMRWCIEKTVAQTILDPFMGSGTTGVAAIQLGRKFIGIEKEEHYFDIACRRIEQAAKQGQLFEPEVKKQVQTGMEFSA